MNPFGPAFEELVVQFARLPGIGRKSAERLANHVLMVKPDEALALARAIEQVKATVRPCSQCFNLTEGELCGICRDSRREPQLLCVVEQPKDLVGIESSGAFGGRYHVLQGRISPLEVAPRN